MNKYIISDIKDGIIHLKAGMANAIADITNGVEKEIELDIDTYMLVAILKSFNYSLLYKDSGIYIEQEPIQFVKVNNQYIVKGRTGS